VQGASPMCRRQLDGAGCIRGTFDLGAASRGTEPMERVAGRLRCGLGIDVCTPRFWGRWCEMDAMGGGELLVGGRCQMGNARLAGRGSGLSMRSSLFERGSRYFCIETVSHLESLPGMISLRGLKAQFVLGALMGAAKAAPPFKTVK